MEFRTFDEMKESLAPALRWNGGVSVLRPADLRGRLTDRLVWTAVFAGDAVLRDTARWILRESAVAAGAWPASILPLYAARGRGECSGFTVPAFNIRGITYDSVRAALAAKLHQLKRLYGISLLERVQTADLAEVKAFAARLDALAAAKGKGWPTAGDLYRELEQHRLNRSLYLSSRSLGPHAAYRA